MLRLNPCFYAAVLDSKMTVKSETWRLDLLGLLGIAVETGWPSNEGSH